MTRPTRISLGILAALAILVAAAVGIAAVRVEDPADAARAVAEGETRLVREDSHVLGEPGDSGVTFVEFLDFECEACLAAYPVVEQLRRDYGGRVTFVARYFPMPGHANGEPAARAVEAAAQQGRFEAMYQRMYETQTAWAHRQNPQDGLFRRFAEEIGLDLGRYDATYADPATLERIEADRADGLVLGVEGTPTFFVDGEPLRPLSVADLTDALDAALAERS